MERDGIAFEPGDYKAYDANISARLTRRVPCRGLRREWRTQMCWSLRGHGALGLVTGVLTGLSKTSTVSTVLPLIFTFAAGGSTVALSSAGAARAAEFEQPG